VNVVLTAINAGYDSTLTTSFKYSSSEEESPRRIDSTGKRKGGGHNLMEWKRRRPVGLVVSGGLELRIESPQEEKENPFKSDECRNHENTLKTYDADDEEGESSEVVLRNIPGVMTETRNGTLGHQDLVLKRKRPNSLNRVSSSSMDKENYCKPKEIKNKTEKRMSKRMMKSKPQESVSKRKMIGISDFPKPYENKDIRETDSHKYLTEGRRQKSEESAAYSNLYNQTSVRLRDTKDPLIERVKQVPLHIAESQKLLKTSIFQLKSPQYPTKCLILNIYKIKYDKRQTTPPAVTCHHPERQTDRSSQVQGNSVESPKADTSSGQFNIKGNQWIKTQPKLQESNIRLPSPQTHINHLGRDTSAHLQQLERDKSTHVHQMGRDTSAHVPVFPPGKETSAHVHQPERDTSAYVHNLGRGTSTTDARYTETQTQKAMQATKHHFEPELRRTGPTISKPQDIQTQAQETRAPHTRVEEKQDNNHQRIGQQDMSTRGEGTWTQQKKSEELKHPAGIVDTVDSCVTPTHRTFAQFNGHTPKLPRKFEHYSSFTSPAPIRSERFNIEMHDDSKFEHFTVHAPKHPGKFEPFKSQTLTPRSKSKYEHLIKNLKESQDDNLVIYKVLEPTPSKPAANPVTPYKEPKDKYTIEYLWNIGATNFQARRPTRKCH